MLDLVEIAEELQPAYAKTLLPNVVYSFPEHKLREPRDPKIAEAERQILKLRSFTREGARERLALGVHEAGHKLVLQKLGVETHYAGQSIHHFRETDRFLPVFGAVLFEEEAIQKLSAEQFAAVSVAGQVAERTILGYAPPESFNCDYENFVGSGKDGLRRSQLILLWKQTEERMLAELGADVQWQQRIVHEAARFEAQIFGLDRSVKTFPESL